MIYAENGVKLISSEKTILQANFKKTSSRLLFVLFELPHSGRTEIIMFLIEWWNSMSLAAQIFACVAIPSSLLLLIQTVMMFFGFGDDSDASDVPDDVSNTEGVFGDDTEIDDPSGFDGLKIFTLRGIIAFFVVFGWVGVAMESGGSPLYATIPVATASGLAIMLALAFLFRAVMKLRNDGNTDNRNAIGVSGKVQLTIPPSRSGEGKVFVMLQGSYVERGAVTDETEAIPTGAEIVVVGVSGMTELVVKRK